jgi:hypothetical protein
MSNERYEQLPFTDDQLKTIENWVWKPWMGKDDRTQLGWFKDGYCPACGDVTVVFQEWIPVLRIAAQKPVMVDADCICIGNHPGRPRNPPRRGCGRTGAVPANLEPPHQGIPAHGPPLPPLDAPEWDKAAAEVARGALDRIRGSCEKWGASVGTLLGIFGVVAIVGGPTAIGDVDSHSARIALVVLILLAGVCAFASTLLAAFGAQGGTPKIMPTWDGMEYRTYAMDQSRKAMWKLQCSRYSGIGAAVLVFLAGLLLLSVSLQSANSPTQTGRVVVVTKAGDVLAGQIDENGQITVGDQKVTNANQVILIKAAK